METETDQQSPGIFHNLSIFLLGAMILAAVAVAILIASVPPTSRDALVHHLAVPKIYLQEGRMVEIPSMDFSYYPMILDLLYLIPLSFGNDIVPKYIHFLFALLTAGLIYKYLRDQLSAVWGLVGALFFLTIPVIFKLSVTVYVDLGLIFFSWASLYFILRWEDRNFNVKYLIYAACCCGLALGTKYNGLLLLFFMASCIPLWYSRSRNRVVEPQDRRQRYRNSLAGIKWGIVFTVVALILFAPWVVRNYRWTHNPVYPLYKGVFNPPVDQDQKNVSLGGTSQKRNPRYQMNPFGMRRYVYKESFAQTVFIPIRMFFQGRDGDPKYFDGKLNPLLLLLPLAAFGLYRPRKLPMDRHKYFLGTFILLFCALVYFKADFRIRYAAPIVPPLVVLSVLALHKIHCIGMNLFKSNWVACLPPLALMGFALSYNANYIYQQFDYYQPVQYLSGKIGRDAYIARHRFEHPAMQWANANLPLDAKVLCLWVGNRTYYLDRQAHLAIDFYHRDSQGRFTEELLMRRLTRYGTTHILFGSGAGGYWNWIETLSREERAAFKKVFETTTELLYEENGAQVLRLLS